MVWFKVDDKLHDHRKARAVRRSNPNQKRDAAPFGLWVLAGSWAGDNGSDGFVPTEILEGWDDNAAALAARLVSAGLWWESIVNDEPGFGFNDWADYVPRPEGIEDASESGKRGNHVRWHEKRGQSDPDCEFCAQHRGDIGAIDRGDSDRISGANRDPVPSRPDPDPNPTLYPDPLLTVVPDTADQPTAKTDPVADEFEKFWSRYPRKLEKKAALKAFRSARKSTPLETIAAGLLKVLPDWAGRDPKHIPHASSWLNGERWADELDAPVSKPRYYASVSQLEEPPDGLSPSEYMAWEVQQRAKRAKA